MKKIVLFGIFIPYLTLAQIENKIEGLTIDCPCELEYTRNLANQNNYSCFVQDTNNKILQYSVTVQNLFEEMNGLNSETLKVFKEQFFLSAKQNAELNNETTKSITLANGNKGLQIESYLTYSGHRFINTSVVLLYKQKSFIVNLTTNDLKNSTNLINRIKIK